MNRYIINILFLFIVLSLKAQTPNAYQKIEVGFGPEDFELDTFNNRQRLIISCSSRRTTDPAFKEIVAMNLSNNRTEVLPRKNEPAGLAFSPHGTDLQIVDGKLKLYVVNHPKGGNDQILIYVVQDDALWFEQAIESPLFISLNSVAALPSGHFYVTNDAGKKNSNWEKLFAMRRSSVVFYHITARQSKLVKDKLAYANGLAIKGNTLYVSTTQKKDLLEMHIVDDGSLTLSRKFKGQKGMDNLTIAGNWLFLPAHPKFLKFIGHMRDASKYSPAEVFVYLLDTGAYAKVFTDSGQNISAPATALYYKGFLYIGQVFNTHLLKVPLVMESVSFTEEKGR